MLSNKGKKYVKYFILCLLIFYIGFGLYAPLTVSRFKIESDQLLGSVRLAVVSDLHAASFGSHQEDLIRVIDREHPDIICFTGDIFDDRISITDADPLIIELAARYPCYYVTGNHEYGSDVDAFDAHMAFLQAHDVTWLHNEAHTVQMNDTQIQLLGIDDPNSGTFDLSLADALDESMYSVLLSHRPEYFDLYASKNIDLVLSGHAHGGQWRIPGILNQGVFAPHQGFFPKYTSGRFTQNQTQMIVSRGLAKGNTVIPRFYNKPELVIVDLDGSQHEMDTSQFSTIDSPQNF